MGSDVGWSQGEKSAPSLIYLLKEMPPILTDRIGEASQRTCKDEGKRCQGRQESKSEGHADQEGGECGCNGVEDGGEKMRQSPSRVQSK